MCWGQSQAAAPGKGATEGEGGNVLHSFKKFDEEGRREENCFYKRHIERILFVQQGTLESTIFSYLGGKGK